MKSHPYQAQPKTTVILFADRAGPKISKHIYGHFAEHLGRCVYNGLYVGSNSTIKNINGIRADVVDALKQLNIPNLRWPGGCFADTYHWKDGVGPLDKRPAMVNTHWGGITEDNSFGTHNFLELCELLDAEPYITGNVGSGTVQEMAEWVQYANFNGEGPMSKWRRENGREKAWKVKYWGLGNEAWGCGGNMTAEYYANEYRKYASYLHNWSEDTRIFRIACGPNSDDYLWTEVLMKNIPLYLLEGIAIHHYAVIDWNNKGSAINFTEEQYFATMQKACYMDELLRKHADIMDRYDTEKKIAIVVDEWGSWYNVEEGTNPGFLYQQNTMRDAMVAAVTLNIFNRHSHRLHMANLAQAVNVLQAVILTDKDVIVLTPTYHVMNMYKVHQEAMLVPLEISSDHYKMGEFQLDAIAASASMDDKNVLHLSLVNIHATMAIEVDVRIEGKTFRSVSADIITSENLQDHNSFREPEKIIPRAFKDFSFALDRITIQMPPFSTAVFTMEP